MSHGVHRGVLKKENLMKEVFIENLKKLVDIKYDLYGMDNNQPVWADNFINKISKSKMKGLNLSQGRALNIIVLIIRTIDDGLLVLVDEKTKFSNFLSKNEIVTYKNLRI